jgi:ribosome biogenesis GTPase
MSKVISATIIKGVGGLYTVLTDEGSTLECKARGIFRKDNIIPLVGDRVIIADKDVSRVIDEITERRNFLLRPALANIDRLVIVSSVVEPRPNLLLIDRLTALAIYNGIEPVIVFTKTDLADASNLKRIYTSAGFKVFCTGLGNDEDIKDIIDTLSSGISAFAGNTGVGKSTLINAIEPSLNLATGEISKKLGRGRHTTRSVELFRFNDGFIADTPGFSSLDFTGNVSIPKDELQHCFPEFKDYIDECRFSGCAHLKDKGCKVREAAECDKIPIERYRSYQELYLEAKQKEDEKYK